MIFFLHGEDTYRSFRKMKELEEKFAREVDPSKINLQHFGEGAAPDVLRQALFSPPFLARKRFLRVDNLSVVSKAAQEEILACLQKGLPEDIIFVVRLAAGSEGSINKDLLTKLKASKYCEEFKILRGKQLEQAVNQMAQEAGGSLTPGALRALIALTGADTWQIKNELGKLSIYCQDRKIEEKDVLAMVEGSFDENIFALLDAVANKKSEQALWLAENQTRGGLSSFLLLSRIIGNLRLLLAVRFLLDQGQVMSQISRTLNLHPYVGEKTSRQIKSWSLDKLKKAYKRLLQVETMAKTGQGDIQTLLTVFLAEFC